MNGVPTTPDGKWYLSVWKHPLTILLIGGILSYVLVPWISEKSAHKRLLQEQRVNKACDILKQGLIDDVQLNSIQTAFKIFNKQAAADPKSYRTAQAELKTSFARLYFEFDQHGWWWDNDLAVQSKLLELPSGSKKTIEELHYAYKDNLLEAAHQLDLLRTQFLAKDYKQGDPHNTDIITATNKTMTDLATARGVITSQLANMFMPPGRP